MFQDMVFQFLSINQIFSYSCDLDNFLQEKFLNKLILGDNLDVFIGGFIMVTNWQSELFGRLNAKPLNPIGYSPSLKIRVYPSFHS
jgi:hypothetical protein